jgi:hypothetical protein
MSACDTVIAARIWKPVTEDAGDAPEAAQAPSGCLSE